MNILYKGLKVRVTQELVKTRSGTILKHSPGTVVGWELYPIDRERVTGAERFLQKYPRCIYIKFEGATWEILPELGPGV